MSPTTSPHRRVDRRRRTARRACVLAAGAVLALGLGGCGEDGTASDGPAGTEGILDGAITVGAAASLTESFTAIGEAFGDANPEAEVTFTFDSSSTLATQIEESAPIDVFASADTATMDGLVESDLIDGAPTTFAGNDLVIVTKPGNPEGIDGLADLADVGTISLCGDEVPCGGLRGRGPRGSRGRGAGVVDHPGPEREGDPHRGRPRATRWPGSSTSPTPRPQATRWQVVAIPDELNVIAEYPIGVVAESDRAAVAEAFVAFVLGEEGQAILAGHGFLPPP